MLGGLRGSVDKYRRIRKHRQQCAGLAFVGTDHSHFSGFPDFVFFLHYVQENNVIEPEFGQNMVCSDANNHLTRYYRVDKKKRNFR